MAVPGENRTSTDHDEIREWAEARGGEPAAVAPTEQGDDPGILRIRFPGYGDDDSLHRISWEEWFQKFEDETLALIYQETTADGEQSTFNKLVRRD